MESQDVEGCFRLDLVRRATAALEGIAATTSRDLDRHAAGYGLSDAKLEMIAILAGCSSQRCCLHEIGERMRVTRPNVTKLVDGLERCGLVQRHPHPTDRRMVYACLTPRGARIAEDALPGRGAYLGDVWASLSDDDLGTLTRLLEAVGAQAGATTRA